MRMWRELMAAVAAMAVLVSVAVFLPVPARSATTEIQDCEGSDMLVVLAPDGRGHWKAPDVYLGLWQFTHVVDVSCDVSSCKVEGGLRALRGSPSQEPTTTIGENAGAERVDGGLLFRSPKNTIRDAWELRGDIAQEIAKSISPNAFLGGDGRNHFVWVDNGQLQATISVRGRTEIVCGLDGDLCTIGTTVLVFVPYDEFRRCGYLSEEAEHTGKEFVPQRFALANKQVRARPHPQVRATGLR